MKILLLPIASILILTGCASVNYNYTPTTKLQGLPPKGEIITIPVGDPLLTQGLVTVFDIIEVPKPTKVSVIVVGNGNYRKVGADKNFEYYTTYTNEKSGKFGGSARIYGSITIRIETKTGTTCFIGDGYKMCPTPAVKLEYTKSTDTSLSQTDLQQTLLYNGKVGNRINIGYREFRGDLARPAFSNDVEYDLSESAIIAYKGASLEVIEANNRSIKYKVISNFR
jgi:hypothetical protein